MARNEEKQLGRLNRLHLKKEKDEYLKKNPVRPKLETLTSAVDVQKWLPSIKKDLDFYVKQSMVTCYPESKIAEFSQRIVKLKWEYKSFLRKLRELDPGIQDTPWTDRPYSAHKRGKDSDENLSVSEPKKLKAFQPIAAPILDQDEQIRNTYGFVEVPQIEPNIRTELQDEPLVFSLSVKSSDRVIKESDSELRESVNGLMHQPDIKNTKSDVNHEQNRQLPQKHDSENRTLVLPYSDTESSGDENG